MVSELLMPLAMALYSSHCRPKAITAPNRPSSSPSNTKGQRMKLSVAPTIFMMAISSRRSKVVSLMVLEMMNSDTISKMAIRAIEMAPATLRTVTKPAEITSSARTSSMPATASTASLVWDILLGSVRWITYRWRNTSGWRSLYISSSSYLATYSSRASCRETKVQSATLFTFSSSDCKALALLSVRESSTKATMAFSFCRSARFSLAL